MSRRAAFCPSCGASRTGARGAEYDLVLADRTRVPIVRELTLGRGAGSTVQLSEPSVSRSHARITPTSSAPVLRDLGSTYGTWVDGRKIAAPVVLRDGSHVAVGDAELVVRRRRGDAEAGRTMFVPPGASIVIGRGPAEAGTRFGSRPRLRSGYALKRLAAGEGSRRWVLKDLVGGGISRFGDAEAELLALLDGRHSIADLVGAAEHRFGAGGSARLAMLLSDLAGAGLLADSDANETTDGGTRLARLLQPRRRPWPGAGAFFERLYAAGGWRLFTRTGLGIIAAIAVSGMAVFGFLVAVRYGTPFVVAKHVAIGGVVFLVGRLVVAGLHETAHALTLASFGRRIGGAGLKLILIFPYLYADTTDAWFEPRARRIAVSAAGPVSDLTFGGAFSLCCLAAPHGAVRDVFFQLAFGAYLGALFNLNPLLERDGYQILVDVFREPGLRALALEQFRRRLAGGDRGASSRLLDRYGLLVVAWTLVTVCFALVMSLRYERALSAALPGPAVWALLVPIWAALLTAPLALVLPGLMARRRRVHA